MASSGGSRRQARSYALQALYFSDLAQVAPVDALEGLWGALVDGEGLDAVRPPESSEIAFAKRLVRGVADNHTRIDEMIESCSTNWRMERMPVVDRNVLRIGTYELMEEPDIPGSVAVNEAVELAKTFGTAESRAFVNGLVDRIGRQLERLPTRKGRGRRR